MSLILKQELSASVPTPASGKGTIFLNENDQVAVKSSDGATSTFPTISTSNTQVFYNDDSGLAGSNAFVFNNVSNTVTVENLTVTSTLVAGDIAVSSIANGTSNVDIVGVSGNVTISVGGTANVLTAMSSGVELANALNVLGNANVGNLGTLGQVEVTGNVIASYFVGNGSQLTGIDATTIQNGTANVRTFSTGGNVSISANGNANVLLATGTGINVAGTLTATGNITGDYFIGNGSQLTGIDATAIQNGTANVRTFLNGNVAVSASGNANILITTGTGVNVSGTLNATGNANVGNLGATEIVATTVSGTLSTASQPNITSTGTLTSLDVSGDITAPNITANTGVFTGNGSGLTNLAGANVTGEVAFAATANSVAGANVSGEVAFAATANSVAGANVSGEVTYAATANAVAGANVSGEVTYAATANAVAGANVSGAVAYATTANSVAGANVSGEVDYAATANSVAGANVTGQVGNALVAGTVYTAAQPNITSVGTLTSLDVTGTTTSGNIYANAGTIGASLLTGTLTTAAQPNITSVGTLSSLDVTGNISSANLSGGNLVSANYISGVLITAAQPNITSTGTLTSLNVTGNANVGNIGAAAGVFTANISANNITTTNKITAGNGLQVTTGALTVLGGNLDVTGNLNVTGNVNYSNVTDLVVGDPLIYIGEDNPGDTVDLGLVASYNNGTYVHTGIARNASTDYWTFFDGVVAEPTTVIDWANATYPTVKMGSLLATTSITTPQYISNVSTGTAPLVVTSTTQVANLNVANAGYATNAGTVTTAAQPNITSVGTLTTLNVSGNANVGNIGGTAGVFTTVTGSLVTASQPNITSVGTLSSLTVTANVTAGNLTTGGALSVTGNANVGNIGAASGVFTGTLSVTGNANVGNLGTAGLIVATGNITGGNIVTAGQVVATGNITGGNIIAGSGSGGNITGANLISANYFTGTLTTAAQPNITSVGTLTSLGVNGTITAVAFTANTGIFTGNGAGLTNLAGANVTGAVSYATTANAVAGANVSGAVSYATTANSVAGANVSGTVSSATSATTAGTVTTAAQPNITSVGTLSSLTVTNKVTAGQLQGDGGNISNIQGGNVSGAVSSATSATTAGTVTTAAQPNITSTGTLSGVTATGTINLTGASNVSLGAIGNVHITGGSANAFLQTDGSGTLSWGTPGGGYYLHTQGAAGTTWTVTHNLNILYPTVEIIDSTGNSYTGRYDFPTIHYVNANAFTATFSSSVAGYAAVTGGGIATVVTPGGSDTLVQYNDAGTLSGSAGFTYDKTTGTLTSGNITASANLTAGNVKTNNLLYSNGSPYVFTTSAGGSNTQVQFNDATAFGGSSAFTFNKSSNTLAVSGTVTATTLTETSSIVLKENFRPIENPLDKILQLVGVMYDRKDGSSKDEIGLVSEDVEKIIPELVKNDTVAYTRLTVYLLESIKILKDQIDKLQSGK